MRADSVSVDGDLSPTRFGDISDSASLSGHVSRRDLSYSPVAPLTTDYVHNAVLCMLRRTENVTLPALRRYLAEHFPDIPNGTQAPVIVAAFTAEQKAAATHFDTAGSSSD